MFKQNKTQVETIIKTQEESAQPRLDGLQRLRDCCFIVGFLTSILMAIALLSFDPADPSWSQTAWGTQVNNLGGQFGALVADSLFFVFGSIAYVIPAASVVATWVFFRKRGQSEPIDFMLWGTRLLGFFVIVLTSCGLADINFDDIWYFSSGGIIGDVLTSLSIPMFNILGSTLVLLFLWGAGFTLLTGISWLAIVEWIGDGAIQLLGMLVNKARGDKEQVLEPNLDSDQPIAIAPEEKMEPKLDVDSEAPQDAQSHYNIHFPAGSEDNPAVSDSSVETVNAPGEDTSETQDSVFKVDESLVEEAPSRSPEVIDFSVVDEEEPTVRSKQLGATIEELEAAAQQDNDLATDDVVEAIYTNASDTPQIAVDDAPWAQETTQQESKPQEITQIEADEPQQPPAFLKENPAVEPSIEPVQELEQTSIEPVHNEQGQQDVSAPVDDPANEHSDPDVAAFQNMVSEAQQNMAGTQNPFLVQQQENLPVPTSPMPTLELLYHPEKRESVIDREALENIARLVESKLADYKIKARVVDIFPGPVITRFELDLAPGVKVSRISGLSMDLARSLSAMAVRVVEVIPGKPYVGLELPNMTRQTVFFSDVVGSPQFEQASSPTTVVLGQDIAGEAVVADLSKMPHVLVAGTTGSGKSVGVNVMILSMLYKATPEEVRFIMIDPKMLELSVYEGIPHLLSEVVTDMKDASNALRWCVGEMERRYKLMSALGVRNIKGYNEKLKMAAEAGHPIHDPLWQPGDSMDEMPPLLEKLPYIVVIVDEFADLMMVVGKKVEELIARLAQKARAAGIHLILATQRPSVDVITGLIKANIPTRVAFTVSTKTDSRTILDQGGAESLLGMGDMLYLPPGSSHTTRVHGAFASDDDVHAVVNDWKARGKPVYIDEITHGDQGPEALLPGETSAGDEDVDPLFDQVVQHVVETRRGSVSGVQRKFKIGYNRAARIVEQLEAQGIVSAPGHNGNREVLAPAPPKD
ncbi:DNA translocase FtsK 4TM domain-containing protein [Vibrio sp. SCSIO 43136]|uniref:DNA translocase FtsK n=1 Tax=Vibrio sp. SCSIO 43136 TaxID=2819101 RepID=UPI0020755D90|nr:DNA translocase FtsK 4TM domain-containing protein [Vibrio sp. SCSIO 43136]USD64380.1 DNA translocase FtsK 4TM domain-containing protein [Vibrio sp. SCSIO 43136]